VIYIITQHFRTSYAQVYCCKDIYKDAERTLFFIARIALNYEISLAIYFRDVLIYIGCAKPATHYDFQA